MHLRIRKMKRATGIIVILSLIAASVDGQSSCIQCDSANENEEDCGFVKDGDSVAVASCSPALGCFTRLYERNDNAYPGWYTKRGCSDGSTCSSSDCSICEGDNNCNGKVFPSDRHKCLKCTDSDCGTPKAEYCNVYLSNSTDCVTLYDEVGGVLIKSCFADIPDSTRELCNDANYLDCKKCSGGNCNTDTKREGTKCHQCSGADCLVVDAVANLVDCRSSCYIGMNSDGEPVRGCSSDFKNSNRCSTDDTSASDCFVCEGDGCNAIIYPTTGRLQCHTCVEGDCEPSDDNLEFCTRYHKDERCASVFDEGEDKIVARGCVSSLESQQRQSCERNSTNCLKCSYDKCNKDDSKLKTEFCIGCNSEDDPNCLKEASNLERRCLTSQCFTRLTEPEDKNFGRHMERGCLNDLLQGTTCVAPDCVSCSGKNCNNKLFPANRISCKSCELGACNGRAVDKICNQFVGDEACFTFFGEDSKVVFRDCYADVPAETREICDDSSNLDCTKCKGSLCNTESKRRGSKCYKCEGLECASPVLPDVVDCVSECFVGVNANGEPLRGCANEIPNSDKCGVTNTTCLKCSDDHCNGIVHPTQDRLTCVKCLNDDCGTLNTVSEFCERWSPNERCVTIFDSADSVVERGCSSTVQSAAACARNSSNCLKCGFDECNVETSIAEKFHCVSCSSKDDPKCVSNPIATQAAACKTSQCYSRLLANDGIGQHIERGCAADLQACTGSSCQSCTGERCNTIDFPMDRHSCLYCSGDHCALGHANEKKCTVYSQQDKNCVTVYGTENEVIYRDCYVDAVEGTRSICDDRSDLTCTKCTGGLCNNDMVRRGKRCLKCEGIDCFNAEDTSNSIDCLAGGCYVGLNAKGEMKRDCATAVSNSSNCVRNDTSTGSCLVCQDDYCNGIMFPIRSRLICKDCLGESCEENEEEEKFCERLHADERCVSIFNNSDKILERGCLSTVQNSNICSGTNANCLKCSFNRCNTQKSKQELFHCVACNSNDDPTCATNSSTSSKTCSTNQCYSRLLPVSPGSVWQHVEKGCLADLPTTTACTGTNCSTCQGERCNNVIFPSDRISCLACRNSDCKGTETPTNVCRLYNSQRQACITLYDTDSEVFYRGCYADAAAGTKEVCDDPSQLLCSKCSSSNCNQDSLRRGKKCYKCQGLECFQPTHPSDVIDCLSNCYMGVNQNGESVRGCSSAFTNTTSCGADDNGVNRCSICSDDLCNGIQFPLQNRLQCHTCNDDDGCEADDDNVEYCERFGEQERCFTVFSKSKQVVERGCSSGLQRQTYCSQNYANCLQCSSSGCNNIDSMDSRLCAICDSSMDPNCVLNPAITTSKYCNKGCFTRLVGQTLTRGCAEDLGETFQCTEGNKCQLCSDSDKCNVLNYPSNRRSCKSCNSLATCQNPSTHLCINHKDGDSCVTVFSGYQVSSKGCLADQSNVNQVMCADTSNPVCSACSSHDNCNIETVRKDENCVVCSSALDSNCAQRPTNLPAEHCSLPSDGQCYTRIMSGATVRGCKGALSLTESNQCRDNTASSQCTITTGQRSNNKILPENRRRCYYCDSRTDASCKDEQKNSSLTLPCKRFVQPEKCLKLNLNDGAVVRGCLADFSADICTTGTCSECDGDGCNYSHSSVLSINFVCLAVMLFISLFRSS